MWFVFNQSAIKKKKTEQQQTKQKNPQKTKTVFFLRDRRLLLSLHLNAHLVISYYLHFKNPSCNFVQFYITIVILC